MNAHIRRIVSAVASLLLALASILSWFPLAALAEGAEAEPIAAELMGDADGGSGGGYSASLQSPAPGESSDTFTWIVSGKKPGPGKEISHIEICGCWAKNDILSVSASSGQVEIKNDGKVKVDNLQDSNLPLTLTIVFKSVYGSVSSGTDLFVKTGGGSSAGFAYRVGGPDCVAPTSTPTNTPVNTPTFTPTATPTVPLGLRTMGFKFHDLNGNGRREANEPLMGNWRILLKNAAFQIVYDTRTISGKSSPLFGHWLLPAGLPEGNYWVVEEQQDGWVQTYPANNNGAFQIHLYTDGSFDLLSQRPSWYEGLNFGNTESLGIPDPDDCLTCPDRVLFQSDRTGGNANIFSAEFDGSDVRQLTSDLADDIQPTWRFSAQEIAFASNRTGDWDIFTMGPDGSGQFNVTRMALAADGVTPVNDLAPSWACYWIAFQSDRDGNWEIYKTDPDGIQQIRLTIHPADDEAPAWSPNGKWVAFQSNRDGNWEIYIMDEKGNNVRRITNNTAADTNPTWSPDGEWIAFQSNRDGQNEIYKLNVESGQVVRLTNNLASDADPDWLPYCDWIFFESDRDQNAEVYRMNENGGDQRNVTNSAVSFDALDDVIVAAAAPAPILLLPAVAKWQ